MLRAERDLDLVAGEDVDTLRRALRERAADAIVLAPRNASKLVELWQEAQHVRWIHALSAGVETLPFDLLRSSSVVVTNSRGLYADALGEFAIAAMLWFAKDLRRLAEQQRERRWEPFTVQRLEGRTVGIVGYGGIGQAIGRRAAAMGMRVLSVRRRQEFGDPTLDEVLAEADYVVLATPLTPATHRLLTRERLASMRPDAVLINVSRGAVLDEAALAGLLREGRIRGAALDVFETEPLPEASPLWALDNVLVSPHSADRTADSHERAMAFYLENLSRFRRGEPLENVVDKEAGY
jgi:phosphoglycerate dehydrogenase-like enzyme